MKDYYHRTFKATIGQDLFIRDITFKLTSIIYWQVIAARKEWKFDIENTFKSATWVRHDYKVGDIVYADKNGIYRNIDYKKHGSYMID